MPNNLEEPVPDCVIGVCRFVLPGTRARSGKFPRLSNSENDGKDAPVHPLVSAAFNSPQDMSSETSTTLNGKVYVCVRACVRAYACVCACVRACVGV